MEETLCKGKTLLGEQCRLKASALGYCHMHDPEKIAHRAAQAAQQATRQAAAEEDRKKNWAKGEQLREVVELVSSVCRAKGWGATVKNKDVENWRYASIFVERYTHGKTIEGVFDISLDTDRIKISGNATSFYSYGFKDLHESICAEVGRLPWMDRQDKSIQVDHASLVQRLCRLLKKFHVVVRQIQQRHEQRGTLLVNDEYDVQDLLHALLLTLFDDVRPEEHSPSYAGASSRIDFLLKKEKIVVEVKMTNHRLKDKLVGDQLIIDIKRYQAHPDCNVLVCLVYDPSYHLSNPIAIEHDLTRKHDRLDVRVIVVPHR